MNSFGKMTELQEKCCNCQVVGNVAEIGVPADKGLTPAVDGVGDGGNCAASCGNGNGV